MQVAKKRVNFKVALVLGFILGLGVFLGLNFSQAEAAEAKIGLINLTKVIAAHPFSENIKQLSLNLQEELKKRQEELNKQGKGLDEVELQKLEDKFNAEWDPVKQKILAEIKSYDAARYADIMGAIKAVGDKGAYDLILNSEIEVPTSSGVLNYPVVLYAGEDITQDVIAEVNRKLQEEQKQKDATIK